MSGEELLRLLQMATLEELGIFLGKELCPQLPTNPVVDVIAGNRGGMKAKAKRQQIESTALGGEDTGSEDQGVAGKERKDNETGLGKDDSREDSINPCAVLCDEPLQVLVKMKNEIDQGNSLVFEVLSLYPLPSPQIGLNLGV